MTHKALTGSAGPAAGSGSGSGSVSRSPVDFTLETDGSHAQPPGAPSLSIHCRWVVSRSLSRFRSVPSGASRFCLVRDRVLIGSELSGDARVLLIRVLLPADEAARDGRGSVRARDARGLMARMRMRMMKEVTCSSRSRAPSLNVTLDPLRTHTRARAGDRCALARECLLFMLVHEQTTVTRQRVTSLPAKHQM